MAISATQVKELRDKTGAGMMDCKKALTEADGNSEKAIEILRKTGASVAAKRSEKAANEGIVKTQLINDAKSGIILEINCETDFVAKSDDFLKFADFVMEVIVDNKPSNIDELLKLSKDGKSVSDALNDIIGKIGEKIEISRFVVDEGDNDLFVDYIHHGAKLGVLVKSENVEGADTEKLVEILKNVAMQTAAMKPLYVIKEEVPQEAIEKEKEIYKEVARKEGKPEQIIGKIAEGKINKYFQEVCLLEQTFIKDNAKSVGSVLDEFNKENSSDVKLSKFYRFHLSDEKK